MSVWLHLLVDIKRRTCGDACVSIDRPVLNLANLDAVSPHLLPGDTVRYLMPLRYCPATEFQTFAPDEFGAFEGGARITIKPDWINEKVR